MQSKETRTLCELISSRSSSSDKHQIRQLPSDEPLLLPAISIRWRPSSPPRPPQYTHCDGRSARLQSFRAQSHCVQLELLPRCAARAQAAVPPTQPEPPRRSCRLTTRSPARRRLMTASVTPGEERHLRRPARNLLPGISVARVVGHGAFGTVLARPPLGRVVKVAPNAAAIVPTAAPPPPPGLGGPGEGAGAGRGPRRSHQRQAAPQDAWRSARFPARRERGSEPRPHCHRRLIRGRPLAPAHRRTVGAQSARKLRSGTAAAEYQLSAWFANFNRITSKSSTLFPSAKLKMLDWKNRV